MQSELNYIGDEFHFMLKTQFHLGECCWLVGLFFPRCDLINLCSFSVEPCKQGKASPPALCHVSAEAQSCSDVLLWSIKCDVFCASVFKAVTVMPGKGALRAEPVHDAQVAGTSSAGGFTHHEQEEESRKRGVGCDGPEREGAIGGRRIMKDHYS